VRQAGFETPCFGGGIRGARPRTAPQPVAIAPKVAAIEAIDRKFVAASVSPPRHAR